MIVINLEEERELLKDKVAKLQSQLAPIQRELQEARERLAHVEALLGQSSEPLPPVGKGYWANLCREHGWDVGGDSAHRVVRRRDPQLHSSIPHKCKIDNRTYP